MKLRISSILKIILLSLFGLLLFVTLCIPAFKATYGNNSINVYLFDLLGGVGLNYLTSSSTGYSVNSFYGVLSILVLVIGVILCVFGEKRITKAIGTGLYLTFFALTIVIFKEVKDVIEGAKETSSYTFGMTGTIMLLVSVLVGLLLVIVCLCSNIIDNAIYKAKTEKKGKTKEERLLELKDLKDKDLISDDEFNEKRKEIIDEK